MVRPSLIITAILIVMLCLLPIIPDTILNIPVKIGFEIVIGIAFVLLVFLLFYKLIDNRLRKQIEKEFRKEQEQIPVPRQIPEPILISLGIYNAISIRNYWAYRGLGIISLAASLYLTIAIGRKSESLISSYLTQLIAYASALSTGVIFTFNLVEKSNRARKAFRILQNAIMKYRYYEFSMPQLIDKYREAEDLLGDDEFKHTTGSGPKS
jgi:hypothetical protein